MALLCGYVYILCVALRFSRLRGEMPSWVESCASPAIRGSGAGHYLDLVPVLHARADVLESSGKPLALVAAQFARARDIRKRSGRAMDPAQPPQRTTP